METLKGGVGVSSITFTFVGAEAGQVPGTGYGLVGGLWNTVESYSPFVNKKKKLVRGRGRGQGEEGEGPGRGRGSGQGDLGGRRGGQVTIQVVLHSKGREP